MLASRRHRRTAVIWSAVGLAGALAVTAGARPVLAHPQPYPLTRVNVSTGGREADAATRPGVGISAGGRFVVFASPADNLVPARFPGPPPGLADIFIRDMTSATTELVSVDSAGAPAAADSHTPTVSDDGDVIAFATVASLTAGDTNGVSDVYVRIRSTGTTTLVSRDPAGVVGDAASSQPMVSADGNHVVFASDATNLVVADTNGRRDVFLAALPTGSVERMTMTWQGAEADEDSAEPAVSSDGRYVVFASEATNLVPADGNGHDDVFLVDRDAGTVERVSVYNTNMFRPDEFDGPSGSPSVSDDGRSVVFETLAELTVTGDTNGTWDVVRRDRVRGRIAVLSDERGGRSTGNGASRYPRISGDGATVTFESAAENLDWESGNGHVDVFVWAGASPVSMRWGFVDGNGASGRPAIDGTGSRIAFTTAADNLVSNDCNGFVDVLVSERTGYPAEATYQPCAPEPRPR